ncbi:hypothetical protein D3C81_1919640 [compost metagenome]
MQHQCPSIGIAEEHHAFIEVTAPRLTPCRDLDVQVGVVEERMKKPGPGIVDLIVEQRPQQAFGLRGVAAFVDIATAGFILMIDFAQRRRE